jgi:Zn-finger nucleic acid-binding protein
VWVAQSTLEGCVQAFLEQEGEHGAVPPLLESPAGASGIDCANCGCRMIRVRLRGVEVDRCAGCRFVLLEPGVAALISRRVLARARALARAQELRGVEPAPSRGPRPPVRGMRTP